MSTDFARYFGLQLTVKEIHYDRFVAENVILPRLHKKQCQTFQKKSWKMVWSQKPWEQTIKTQFLCSTLLHCAVKCCISSTRPRLHNAQPVPRYRQHIRYIRTNTHHLSYALHTLLVNSQHEYGPPKHTLHMLQPCHKGNLMSMWENFCMQQHLQILIDLQYPQHLQIPMNQPSPQHLQLPIDQQSPQHLSPQYTLGRISRQLATPSEPQSTSSNPPHTTCYSKQTVQCG
jgi:hypothetical protein